MSGAKYRPEFPALLVKFFSDMLENSEVRIRESFIKETRTAAEPSKEQQEPEIGSDGKPKKKRATKLKITTKRINRRESWRVVMAELPSMPKFARLIGVSRQTLYVWAKQYPTFQEAMEMAKDMFEDALIQRGLQGWYPPELVKIIGENWGTLRDRKEITGADGAPLNPPPELKNVPISVLESYEQKLIALRKELLAGSGAPVQSSGEGNGQ